MPSATRPLPPSPAAVPRQVAWLAGGLTVLAIGAAAASGPSALLERPLVFGGLVASTLALDAIRIDLFHRLRTSPASLPVLVLAALFGAPGVIAVEALVLGQRALRRNAPVRYVFDFGALSIAGCSAALVFEHASAEGADLLAVGALAGLAYYATNMPLLSLAIGLTNRTPPWSNFREQLSWLLPHYLGFGALAGVFVVAEDRLGISAFVLFGIPAAVLWTAEKQYLARSRASVEELRRSHSELQRANRRLLDLLESNRSLLERLQRSYLSTITSLARTIEAKDPYTSGHTERVSGLARDLAVELGFADEELRAIEVGAVIHDIGKIGVSDGTLLKAGPLEPDERAEIERHPEISSYILAELDIPPIVKQMVRSHHERYDGSGYPDRLAGEDIPLPARILAVADAIDAMTSDRPYRPAMPLPRALDIVDAGRGTQFCPAVVGALHRSLARRSSRSPFGAGGSTGSDLSSGAPRAGRSPSGPHGDALKDASRHPARTSWTCPTEAPTRIGRPGAPPRAAAVSTPSVWEPPGHVDLRLGPA